MIYVQYSEISRMKSKIGGLNVCILVGNRIIRSFSLKDSLIMHFEKIAFFFTLFKIYYFSFMLDVLSPFFDSEYISVMTSSNQTYRIHIKLS